MLFTALAIMNLFTAVLVDAMQSAHDAADPDEHEDIQYAQIVADELVSVKDAIREMNQGGDMGEIRESVARLTSEVQTLKVLMWRIQTAQKASEKESSDSAAD